ncbi:MAG: L,D-transpeptidase [Bdellovibrionales bacterium]|nr:L,D-transpeptidase [Bdellovibrionales bacterium]
MLKLKWILRVKNHPLTSLTAGLLVGAVISSCSVNVERDSTSATPPTASASGDADLAEPSDANSVSSIAPGANQEISPDEFARELGLPSGDDEPFSSDLGLTKNIPQTRTVSPEHFGDFRVNVDIFRRSSKRPVLGEFRDEYTAVLVPNDEGLTPEQRTAAAKKIYATLAAKEFAVASLDGVPFKAYIISGAIEQRVATVVKDASGKPRIDPATGQAMTRLSMKSTPAGNYRLDAIAYDRKLKNASGERVTVPVAFPWLRSRAYNNSQMYWGLWIKGGYFIHSTPHYGELGRPASMGCIRQSFPDAQELFKLVVDDGMSAMVRIHALGSEEAVSRLVEITSSPRDATKDMNWVVGQLAANYQKIRDSIKYYGSELNIVGHSWLDDAGKPAATTWPTCGDLESTRVDCFKAWTVRKPKNSTN